VIAAFAPVTTDRGVVMAISRNAITLRVAGGGSLTLALNAGTRFKFHGTPARRAVARPGAQVAVTHAADAPATVVNVLKRAGA
jgi:spore coat protein U-like protein